MLYLIQINLRKQFKRHTSSATHGTLPYKKLLGYGTQTGLMYYSNDSQGTLSIFHVDFLITAWQKRQGRSAGSHSSQQPWWSESFNANWNWSKYVAAKTAGHKIPVSGAEYSESTGSIRRDYYCEKIPDKS